MSGIKRDFYDVCPDCWSVRVKFRVFKSPRYKCEKCGSEFPNKKRISHEDRILFNRLVKKAQHDIQQRYGSPVEGAYVYKIVVRAIKELKANA